MKYPKDLFVILCLALTACTLLLLGGNIMVITFRGLKSLPECIRSENTQFAIFLSMKSALLSTLLCFLLAVPTAYTLTHLVRRTHRLLEILLELTMSLPNIVIGLSLLILCSSPPGKALKGAGFPMVFHSNGIILAQLVVNLPFAVKLISTAFGEVDRKLENVAGLLGAGPAARFFRITLPLSKNALISTVILIWSRALGEFGATLMLVGVTRMKTETLPAGIYLNVSVNDISAALACAFILLLISAAAIGISGMIQEMDRKRSRYVL